VVTLAAAAPGLLNPHQHLSAVTVDRREIPFGERLGGVLALCAERSPAYRVAGLFSGIQAAGDASALHAPRTAPPQHDSLGCWGRLLVFMACEARQHELPAFPV